MDLGLSILRRTSGRCPSGTSETKGRGEPDGDPDPELGTKVRREESDNVRRGEVVTVVDRSQWTLGYQSQYWNTGEVVPEGHRGVRTTVREWGTKDRTLDRSKRSQRLRSATGRG